MSARQALPPHIWGLKPPKRQPLRKKKRPQTTHPHRNADEPAHRIVFTSWKTPMNGSQPSAHAVAHLSARLHSPRIKALSPQQSSKILPGQKCYSPILFYGPFFPALRAKHYSEGTVLFCRLPLTTLFYLARVCSTLRPAAVMCTANVVRISPPDFHGPSRTLQTLQKDRVLSHLVAPLLQLICFQGP